MDLLKKIPQKNQHYVLQQMDDEQLLYNPMQTKTIYLNSSAAVIWELCDGENSLAEIVAALESTFPDAKDQIAQDVIQSIDELVNHQAISLK